ncbi:SRPBCC domain-containing protein [Spongiactinospora rosea]|uniref:SRPBCC domain-containing protein n=1 Tax=Spongiactinospora rosea TaxID=2248750 RepID=UPI001CEC9E6A|nr:SRPBCC domain-containing protein [Spongiactinospora rosea]
MTDGTLETIDGRPALRFERILPHSVERVWRAVSMPAELERWFPATVDWTPAEGEALQAYGATGEVTEVDAPHRLAWTFGGEHYRFELSAQQGGCRLIFTHVFGVRAIAAQVATGWHTYLSEGVFEPGTTGDLWRNQREDLRRHHDHTHVGDVPRSLLLSVEKLITVLIRPASESLQRTVDQALSQAGQGVLDTRWSFGMCAAVD